MQSLCLQRVPCSCLFPSPHTCLHIFFLCNTAQELLLHAVLQRLGTPRVPHILQQILLLQVSSLLPSFPSQSQSLSAASLSYVRQRVLIKRSTAGYQRNSGRAAFCVSLSPPLPFPVCLCVCLALFVALLNDAHKYATVFVLCLVSCVEVEGNLMLQLLLQRSFEFNQFPFLC